ncbi:MAG: family 20 glycosylhydrolase [Clostridia bacterium]|nr:family 20 glycosylhydrolase [Clostridia bacterium]
MIDKLFPRIQKYEKAEGVFALPESPVVLFHKDEEGRLFKIISAFKKELFDRAGVDCYPVPDYAGKLTVSIEFKECGDLSGEKYVIEVSETGIVVLYGEPVAAFRAKETLIQLIELSSGKVPAGRYEDWPCLEHRGFMLDISRAKVPKIEKLFRLVDIMASLKMNELQLYLETYVYEYQSFPQHAHIAEALTPFEILQLTNYAKERYIDLVPNQNSFGHLYAWLKLPEFMDLRVEDKDDCGSINPIDPRSLDFIEELYSSLLPAFDSKYLNVGCDEVWGLRNGKTKEKADKVGTIGVYLDYLDEICKKAEEHDHRPMFWADILLNHKDEPDVIKRVSKNMIPLAWNYDGSNEDFEKNGALLSSLGFDFYICPGTSSWTAMFPDLKNSCLNVLKGAEAAIKYGARGLLMTEWGDFGHIQFDFAMQHGLIYAGALAWNLEGNRDFDLACAYADRVLYPCDNGSVSDIIRLGASLYDQHYFWTFHRKFTENGDPKHDGIFCLEHYQKIKQGMQDIIERSKALKLTADDGEILRDELIVSAELYSFMTDFMLLRLEYAETGAIENVDEKFEKFLSSYETVKAEVKRCWNMRNKEYDNDCMFRLMNKAMNNMVSTVKGTDGEKK